MRYVFLVLIFAIFLVGCSHSDSAFVPEKITYLSYGGSAINSPFAITELIITNESIDLLVFSSNGSITFVNTRQNSQKAFDEMSELFVNLDYFNWNTIQKSSTPSPPGIGVANLSLEDEENFRTVLFNPNAVLSHGPQQQIVLETLQTYVRSFAFEVDLANTAKLNNYTYQPIKCNTTSWNQWYLDGNIQFIVEPAEIDLIYAYYGSQNIDIEEIQIIPVSDLSCDACGCNETYSFEAQSYVNITGWQLKNQSKEE